MRRLLIVLGVLGVISGIFIFSLCFQMGASTELKVEFRPPLASGSSRVRLLMQQTPANGLSFLPSGGVMTQFNWKPLLEGRSVDLVESMADGRYTQVFRDPTWSLGAQRLFRLIMDFDQPGATHHLEVEFGEHCHSKHVFRAERGSCGSRRKPRFNYGIATSCHGFPNEIVLDTSPFPFIVPLLEKAGIAAPKHMSCDLPFEIESSQIPAKGLVLPFAIEDEVRPGSNYPDAQAVRMRLVVRTHQSLARTATPVQWGGRRMKRSEWDDTLRSKPDECTERWLARVDVAARTLLLKPLKPGAPGCRVVVSAESTREDLVHYLYLALN